MDLRIAFNPPTTYANLSPLDPADINSYSIEGSVFKADGTTETAVVSPASLPGAAVSAVIAVINGVSGDTVALTLRTNAGGRTSDPSGAASLLLPNEKPNPPSAVTLSIA